MQSLSFLISSPMFKRLAQQYREATGYGIALFCDGAVHNNHCLYYPWETADTRQINPDRMIAESLRWGEPTIALDSTERYVWAVPLTLNNMLLAGLVSASHAGKTQPMPERQVNHAAWELLRLACRHNLCNTSLLELNREQSRVSARKAEAIETLKKNPHQHPREIYLREEFELLTAIKKGHKEMAREVINRILVGVYNLGRGNFEILKTLVLEMVVLMYRAAVTRGADPAGLLGVNSVHLKDFHKIDDDFSLSRWLTEWLEAFISSSFEISSSFQPPAIALALEYMKNNLGEELTRDKVARYCNMSPGYFSKVFHTKTGFTFTDLLNKFRVEQACFLLQDTPLTVYEIAYQCGFNDQSYFNRVFKKYRQQTPKKYRNT
jgi:AraC-like DNA-binding protein